MPIVQSRSSVQNRLSKLLAKRKYKPFQKCSNSDTLDTWYVCGFENREPNIWRVSGTDVWMQEMPPMFRVIIRY